MPSHYTDTDGVTDFKNEADVFYSQWREGFGHGRTNNEGYVNLTDYTPGMNIEILITGTSHMEAHNVNQEDSAASLLGSAYGMKVYNAAVSGQSFASLAAGLKAGVKKYKPSKFAVIETGSVNFTENEISSIINDKVKRQPPHDKGIVAALRRVSFLRLMYHQFVKPLLKEERKPEKPAGREILSQMLAKLNDDVSLSGAKLIIAYHPPVSLNNDGSMKINDDPQIVKQFSELCADNGIYFINMAGRFLDEYRENHTLPYGFVNTSVGKGHMNKAGHRIFAAEIYRLIQGTEAES